MIKSFCGGQCNTESTNPERCVNLFASERFLLTETHQHKLNKQVARKFDEISTKLRRPSHSRVKKFLRILTDMRKNLPPATRFGEGVIYEGLIRRTPNKPR